MMVVTRLYAGLSELISDDVTRRPTSHVALMDRHDITDTCRVTGRQVTSKSWTTTTIESRVLDVVDKEINTSPSTPWRKSLGNDARMLITKYGVWR